MTFVGESWLNKHIEKYSSWIAEEWDYSITYKILGGYDTLVQFFSFRFLVGQLKITKNSKEKSHTIIYYY